MQRTLLSLMERTRRLRRDITRILLDDDDDVDRLRGNQSNEDYASSGRKSNYELQDDDVTYPSLDANSCTSGHGHPLEELSIVDSIFSESSSFNVKDDRQAKIADNNASTIQIPTKQTSFQTKERSSVGAPRNRGGDVVRKNTIPRLRNTAPIENNVNVFCSLLISEGDNFASRQGKITILGRNSRLYLSCRAFWRDSVAKSDACWPSSDGIFPFGFRHEALTAFSESVLERRIKNNVMVVEVWLDDADHGDRLVGTCKLPLQLIYDVFGKATDPTDMKKNRQTTANKVVVAVDDILPVSDLMTGCTVGRLRVLLIVGTEQRHVKQRLVDRILTNRLAVDTSSCTKETSGDGHLFEVTVRSVMLNRPPSDNQVWGESNCRVDYQFSGRPMSLSAPVATTSTHSASKVHHLNWVLSEPLMHWNSSSEHVVDMSPVFDRDGVISVSSRSTIAGSIRHRQPGFQFRLICMHYYPSERLQLLSEVNVPLPELSVLVAKSGVGKTFNLPLVARVEDSDSANSTIGMLTVDFRHRCCMRPYKMMSKSDVVSKDHKATNTSVIYCSHEGVDTVPTKEVNQGQTDFASPERRLSLTAPKDIAFTPKVEKTLISVVVVGIERAVHLRGRFADELPNAYVILETLNTLCTKVVMREKDPVWNFKASISLTSCGLIDIFKMTLVFCVHHKAKQQSEMCKGGGDDDNHNFRSDDDPLIGRVSVDLSPLKYGLPLLCGWYNIMDTEAHCNGQLKVIVQPTDDHVDLLKGVMADDDRLAVPGDDPNNRYRFSTSGSYVQFPSHIGQFTEQRICWEASTTEDRLADIETVDETASRSFLADNLRRRLKELDDLLVGRATVKDSAELSVENLNSVTLSNSAEQGSHIEVKSKVKAGRRCRVAAAIYNATPKYD